MQKSSFLCVKFNKLSIKKPARTEPVELRFENRDERTNLMSEGASAAAGWVGGNSSDALTPSDYPQLSQNYRCCTYYVLQIQKSNGGVRGGTSIRTRRLG